MSESDPQTIVLDQTCNLGDIKRRDRNSCVSAGTAQLIDRPRLRGRDDQQRPPSRLRKPSDPAFEGSLNGRPGWQWFGERLGAGQLRRRKEPNRLQDG